MSTTDISLPEKKFQSGLNVTRLSLIVNFFLIIIKASAGITGNSFALVSDAMHSASDLITDFGCYIGFSLASKPKDSDHPYGHGKIENYTAHLMGLVLMTVGLLIGFASAWSLLYRTHVNAPRGVALVAASISIVTKEILYHITIKTGQSINSQSLIANAWHHRSDALTSVAALFGVGCAFFMPALHVLDEIISILIASVVIYIGFSITSKAFKDIIDTAPPKEICSQIKNMIRTISQVRDVHDLRARYYSSCIFLDVHITVDPEISVFQGHAIAKQVEKKLLNGFEEVMDVTVHVDPDKTA
ncbi:MAG: cation diffusion facilitator family transporter [Candidatus Auribacterota bacterium]